jgi:hypothetical protein
LEEYDGLDEAGKGALLRRKGLYTSLISAWRQARENLDVRGETGLRWAKGWTIGG